MINAMENFLRNTRDPFIRAKVHAMLRSILILIVMVPCATTFLQANDHLGPSLFVATLDMGENIRSIPNEECR